jgi:hypothetical protein
MPMVAVYVRAQPWRELASEGDPADLVRQHVRDWLDLRAERADAQRDGERSVADVLVALSPRRSQHA